MTHRILTIALAVFALVLAASPALAAKAPHRYSPRHGAKCRKAYKRVKHGKKVYCVKRAPKKKAAATSPPAPAPTTTKTKLHAHLDPTFTRNPLNPFEVTYDFSASASQQTFSAADFAIGGEDPAPLPSGVLALYSDGKLECAVNVGSGVEGSECPVEYKALGQHTVTTIYTSGEQSATETETEEITPLATETTLKVNYVPLTVQEGEEVEPGTGLYHIGELLITATGSPSSLSPHLGCGEGSTERLTPSGCYQVEGLLEHVYANDPSGCLQGIRISKGTSWAQIDGAEDLMPKGLEEGAYHFRASIPSSAGYASSEAVVPIQFKPGLTFSPDC
jgi:hypothetical protein